MSSYPKRWAEISREPISIDVIRELHTPASQHRISTNRYEAGVTFRGTHRAGRLYVLSGSCSLRTGEWQAEILASTLVDFPAGDFEFEVLGDEPVQLVKVWFIK